MKISNYNQLLAISTLLSGMIIFGTLWQQYQKVEQVSRAHFESRLLVQTIEHLLTMSKIWLTTQDLLFSGKQTYLTNGINEQSQQLLQTLLVVKGKSKDEGSVNLIQQLIDDIKKNDIIVNSFSKLSMLDSKAWHTSVAASDSITSSYAATLKELSAQISQNSRVYTKTLTNANNYFNKLTWIVVSLYLIFVLSIVTWFSKYIVKPVENITTVAQQFHDKKQAIEFRQANAPAEIIALSTAIQRFTQSITIEKQKAEQERINVIKMNEQVNAIMETIPCSLLLLNEQGIIQSCNPESSKLFAKHKNEIINKDIASFIPALATLSGKFDTETALKIMEESLLAPNFDKPYIEFSGRKMTINGQVNYLITISDINERKHSQKALSALNQQLVNAEKLASIGQLSAGIAHEINNPVGFICSNLDVLTDYCTPLVSYINMVKSGGQETACQTLYQEEDLDYVIKDIKPLIESTLEGAARVSKIIKDLGTYAHVDNKEPEPILIDDLIEKGLTLVTNELKYKVEIVKSLEAKVKIIGFPQKLLQVFINMLVNASHAIETKGRISISSNTYQGEVNISFEDSGSGIAQENLTHIFDPFFTTKPVGKGTGLGLHIVRTIIDEHKGRIDVSSIEGKGSKFDIYLPIHH